MQFQQNTQMPFYESRFLFHKYPLKSKGLPTGREHPIELPPYRNGNQRQLRLPDNDHAVILEINVTKGIYEQHGYLSGENFERMGMITRSRGRFSSTRIFWEDTPKR